MEMNAEEILSFRGGPAVSEGTRREAIAWLGESLAATLGYSAELHEFFFDEDSDTAYVNCRVVTTDPRPPFALQWEAVVSLKITQEASSIDATLFLFSDGHRLGRSAHYGSDTVFMSFGSAGWSTPSWDPDAYGEWESVVRARSAAERALAGRELEESAPAGAFDQEWQLSKEPGSTGRATIVYRLLHERVGRLIDKGKSVIAAHASPSGTWVLDGWQPDDPKLESAP